jgi:hypothetical protein
MKVIDPPHPILKHPNIVKYKGYDKSPEYLYIILELVNQCLCVENPNNN